MSEVSPTKMTCTVSIHKDQQLITDTPYMGASLLAGATLILEAVPREELVAFIQHLSKRAAELHKSKP